MLQLRRLVPHLRDSELHGRSYSPVSFLRCFQPFCWFLDSKTGKDLLKQFITIISLLMINSVVLMMKTMQQIPKWWVWLYYLTPTSWTLNVFFSSQYGDIHETIDAFGESTTVARFLEYYFGFHHDRLVITAIVLIAFPVALASMFAFFVAKLNFQKR